MLLDKRLVSFGGNAVRLKADHPALLQAIATHFAHCFTETEPLIANFQIAATPEAHFSILDESGVLFSGLNFEQALWSLMHEVLIRLNGQCAVGPVFHAAALAQTGQGLILCGRSGSGKSTLAAWLVANGFHYLTDEVIVYAPESEKISGFARSLILKRGSAFIWQHWLPEDDDREGFLNFADGSAWIDPCLLNPDGVVSQAKPCWLLFPEYLPESDFQTKSLSPAETLFYLLQNLVNARNLPNHGLEAASLLARQVTAFKLTYSNLKVVTTWIQQTISTR
jgi:hypothetical protein